MGARILTLLHVSVFDELSVNYGDYIVSTK